MRPISEREPKWGPVGEVIHKRSYAATKHDGELEKWHETVIRVVDGNLSLVEDKHHETNEREELIERLFEFEMIPGGRHLAMAGKPGRQFLFNCHVAGWHPKDVTRHFVFTFDQLMQGGGVGSNYSDRFVAKYPRLKSLPQLHIVCDPEHENYDEMVPYLSGEYSHAWSGCFRVPDSREGWCDAYQNVMEAFWSPEEEVIVLDMSLIRPRGHRIRTFGGTSSGPMYLAKMLTNTHALLSTRVGARMRWNDAMLMDHLIAECVVSGNVRRSARMAMKWWSDPDIFEFIDAKKQDGLHWSTNISVVIDDDFFRALRTHDEHAIKVLRKVTEGMFTNGEPGFYNFSRAMEGEINEVFCTNPCFHPDTVVETIDGQVKIKDITEPTMVYSSDEEGRLCVVEASAAFKTKKNAETLKLTFNNGRSLVVTPDHKIAIPDKGWMPAGELSVGMPVVGLNRARRGACYSGVKLSTEDNRAYRMEHRMIYEAMYGPLGPDEDVHHGEGGTYDNSIDNLEAMPHDEHARLTALEQSNDHQVRNDVDGKWSTHAASRRGAKTIVPMPDHLRSAWPRQPRITKIEKGPRTDVYDITVPETHSLIADGVLAHNCGEIPLPEWGNCFVGTEEILTKEYGAISFNDIVGESVTVMTPKGWKKAETRSFGTQAVQRITFAPVRRNTGDGWQRSRSNFLVDVTATDNHRWETVDGDVTDSLQVGDVVPMNAAKDRTKGHNKKYEEGVRHGIIFGDGSCDRQYANGDYRHRVRLFGDKADQMAEFFEHKTYPPSCNGAPEATVRSHKVLKDLPDGSEGVAYLSGFLDGWIMADGSERPNGSQHLGSSHPLAMEWLRKNAAMAGWVLRGARDSGVQETNLGERKNPLWFFTLARPDDKNLAWRVVSIEKMPEREEVYCVTVPEIERFTLASGIATMNCNLGHVNLDAHCDPNTGAFNFARAEESFRLMGRFLTRATFGDVPNPLQKRVNDQERRIGVGFTGFHGWLVKQGIRWSESHHNPYVRKTLRDFHEVVRKEARRYAFSLRIPEPVKCTTLAPVGTGSKLPGVSESMEPIKFRYFEQRIRFSADDPNVEEQAAKGYTIEDDTYTPNTKVVVIPCKNNLLEDLERIHGIENAEWLLEEASEIPLDDMLAVQQMVQAEYADNAISFTVNRPPDAVQQKWIEDNPTWDVDGKSLCLPAQHVLDDAERTLKHFLPRLKGTTVMVDGSRTQAPFTKISKEQYESGVGVIAESFDGECAGGACDWAGTEIQTAVLS